MDLSHTVRYAVGAMVYLADRQGQGMIPSRDIGNASGISVRFLMKILRQLAAADLLHSCQGPGGGYRLDRPANRVTLLDIIQAVDGPLNARRLLTWSPAATVVDRRFEEVCDRAAAELRRAYGNVRLSDLLSRSKRAVS